MIRGSSIVLHVIDIIMATCIFVYILRVIGTMKRINLSTFLDDTLNLFKLDNSFRIPRIFIWAIFVSFAAVSSHIILSVGPMIYLLYDIDMSTIFKKPQSQNLDLIIQSNAIRDYVGLLMTYLYLRGVKRLADKEETIV